MGQLRQFSLQAFIVVLKAEGVFYLMDEGKKKQNLCVQRSPFTYLSPVILRCCAQEQWLSALSPLTGHGESSESRWLLLLSVTICEKKVGSGAVLCVSMETQGKTQDRAHMSVPIASVLLWGHSEGGGGESQEHWQGT